jgi:outer membrane protein OmpA-like peptidoglycan-associated protein
MRTLIKCSAAAVLLVGILPAQDARAGHRPLYEVTIVSRTTKAVNYGHRTAPTTIGFVGTPLMADARGKAVVEAKQGATVIRARFSKVPPPTRFGKEYLTYVVWAISPDGRPQNLGELVLNGSDKGKLTASTNLQTFALIVTAEPHYSVQKPSDVVVMENKVGPDTVGNVEEVNATYELLPRQGYTYDPRAIAEENTSTRKPVSQAEYDSILAIYQAQNAIQMAEAEGAAKYSAERLDRARQLYLQARGFSKSRRNEAIATAREATQVAEDARRIAVQRSDEDRAAKPQAAMLNVQPARIEPEPPPQEAVAPPPEQGERTRIELPPPVENPPQPAPAPASNEDLQVRENRARIVSALQRNFETVDSPKGIVVTLPSSITENGALPDAARRIADAVREYPNIRVEVGAHSDREGEDAVTQQEAEAVRQALAGAGLPSSSLVARGYGNSNPRGPNTSGGPAIQNRRIEVVISGGAIGDMASWDRRYSIR